MRQGIYTPTSDWNDQDHRIGGRLKTYGGRSLRAASQVRTGVHVRQPVRNFGVVASVSHSYKEQSIDEDRRFFRIGDAGDARGDKRLPHTDRDSEGATRHRRQLAYQFTPNQRLSFENFYTHTGHDEGRIFEGQNLDNAREYRNYRLQFIEEGLFSNALGGEHFFQNLSNSRLDWRANYARATRDEPDLRETLYERS